MNWIKDAILQKTSWRNNLFYTLLIVLMVALPFSVALMSSVIGLLAIQWVFTFNLKLKYDTLKGNRQVWFVISIVALYLVSLPFTNDFSHALYEIKKMLLWLAIPLIFASYKFIGKNRFNLLLLVLVVAVTVAGLISLGNLFLFKDLSLMSFREATYVAHIRFSILIVFAIGVVVNWLYIDKEAVQGKYWRLGGHLVILVLFFTLLILKSFIGYIAMLTAILITILYFSVRVGRKKKVMLRIIFATVIIVPLCVIGFSVYKFYQIEEIDQSTIDRYTPGGNYYKHDFIDKTIENGHYVYLYICKEELEIQWNQVKPNMPFLGKDRKGNKLEYTLLRYMTSKGLRKDECGFKELDEEDYENICNGITNYIYVNGHLKIYPRIYETIWELDQYWKSNNPDGKSLAMRIEYLKLGVHTYIKKPIWGIGVGNIENEISFVHGNGNFKSKSEPIKSTHNQYLDFLIKFGIVGFLWIMFVIYKPLKELGYRRNFLFLILLSIFTAANFGDANFEDHTGMVMFITLYSIILWHSGISYSNDKKITPMKEVNV